MDNYPQGTTQNTLPGWSNQDHATDRAIEAAANAIYSTPESLAQHLLGECEIDQDPTFWELLARVVSTGGAVGAKELAEYSRLAIIETIETE